MTDKTLEPGDAWLGFFDHPSDAVRRVGMLKRDKNSIQLHSPQEGNVDELLATLGPLQAPPQPLEGVVHFVGPQGKATLIGLRTWPAMLSFHHDTASGIAGTTADVAVFGTSPNVNYGYLHAMRSRVEGLEGFYRYSTVEVERDAQDGRFTVTVDGQQQEDIFPDGVLLIQTNAQVTTHSSGSHNVNEYIEIVSRTEEPEDYRYHLEMHLYVADLLTALNDVPCHVYDIEVKRDDAVDGWCPMALASDGNRPAYRPTDTALPVAARADLSNDSLFRWMGLYSQWHRELSPLARLPRLRGAFIDAQFSQLGVGLEGVGYRLCLRDQMNVKEAAKYWLQGRIERIVADLGPAANLIPADLPKEIADAYNGIKHANRELPTPEYLRWLLPQGVGLFQLWLVRQLGASDSHVASQATTMFGH